MKPVNFSQKTFALITGASQGIGRTIAVELVKCLTNDSTVSLVARSQEGLKKTRSLIKEINNDVKVNIHSVDLKCPDAGTFKNLLENIPNVEQAIIIHNVGQIGSLDRTTALVNIQEWRDYFDLNFFYVAILNSIFITKFSHAQRFVVNITSLCGRQPFNDMALYGSGKAARELYFKVVALEEKNVVVLNYSPGPVDTAMIAEVIDNAKSGELKAMFGDMKEKKSILTPLQTVQKLLGILEKGDYKSGDVIDYFDRE